MKLLLLMLFFSPLIVTAQNANPDRLPSRQLHLTGDKIAPGEIKLPFSSIKLIDCRFDTSKLGFMPAIQVIHNKKRVGRKVILEGGVAAALEKYYNEYYENTFTGTDVQLLIVIKKLWLSGVDNEKNKPVNIVKNRYAGSFLYCKLEYYFNRGDFFFPFKRLDTVVNGVAIEVEKRDMSHYVSYERSFELILKGLIETIDFNKALDNIERLPQKTWAEVEKFNASYFNIPVLKDSAVAKGVFLNFNEFRQNKPSIVNFTEGTIRIKSNKTENYLDDEHGNRILNYWGYCNGQYLKIGKYGNDEAFRKGNAFELFVINQQFGESYSLLYGTVYKDTEYWIPYQLDMETGDLY